jgi:hypothetical protein
MRRLSAAVALAASLFGAGCASETQTADDDASDDAIVGGRDAKGPELDAVGTIGHVYTGGTFDAFCTGTLIAADKVVTAKHCAQASTEEAPWVNDEEIGFAVGGDADKPKRVYKAKSVELVAPNQGGFIGFGADVAIYTLAERVGGVTPAKLATGPLTARDVGRRFTAVGFGAQDYEGTKRGTRRSGPVTLRAVSGSPMQAMYGSEQAYLDHLAQSETSGWVAEHRADLSAFYKYTLLPGREVHVGMAKGDVTPCDGDSGGPLLAKSGKDLIVLAVVSGSKKGKDGRCSVLGETYALVAR